MGSGREWSSRRFASWFTIALMFATAACSRSPLGEPVASGSVSNRPPPSQGNGGGDSPPSAFDDGTGGQQPVAEPPPGGGAITGMAGSDDPFFIPNGPQGAIREDNFCVGFGITVPVIDQPPVAGPFFCGLNCAYGMACPLGLQCWGVFEPGPLTQLPSGDYVSPTDIVAYQCFPPDGACPEGQPPGTLCASCQSDADCR